MESGLPAFGILPFFKNVTQPQITCDWKYFPGLETFPFWMELHSMEDWSLCKTTKPIISLNLHKVISTCVSEPPLPCSIVVHCVSLSQNIQHRSPNSKARSKQLLFPSDSVIFKSHQRRDWKLITLYCPWRGQNQGCRAFRYCLP